jgi:GDP-L-fucose synthase
VTAIILAERLDVEFLAAAKVGGTLENCGYAATIIRDNRALHTKVIREVKRAGMRRPLFLGSSPT